VNGGAILVAAIMVCSSAAISGGPAVAQAPARRPPMSGLFVPASGPSSIRTLRGVENYTTSENWAGYVQSAKTQDTFTQVTDTFVVPTVDTSIEGIQDAADWVGVGGFGTGDRSLVQAGIESENDAGTVYYTAWTETLPHPEDPLDMTISPGDTVTVTVQEIAKNRWLMQVQDGAQIGSRTVHYRSLGLSVEAIHERPCIRGSCTKPNDFATLAQTSNITFVPGFLSVSPPGQTPIEIPLLVPGMFGGPGAVIMQGANSYDDAAPSLPDAANDGFTVADDTIPPPPNT
jgi:Peptidase A4 family